MMSYDFAAGPLIRLSGMTKFLIFHLSMQRRATIKTIFQASLINMYDDVYSN